MARHLGPDNRESGFARPTVVVVVVVLADGALTVVAVAAAVILDLLAIS